MTVLIALLIIPFAWALSNSMIIPILPQIQTALSITDVQAGLLITALSVPTAIFLPFSGFLSDHYGRVKIMIPALILYGLGGAAAFCSGILGSYPLMVCSRIVQGVGASGTNLLALSYAGDLYTGHDRTRILSYLEAANSTGKLVSPLLGTAAAALAWYAPFLIYPLVCLLAIVGLVLFKAQPRQAPEKLNLKQYFKTLWTLLVEKGRSLTAALLAAFITVFIWFGNLYFVFEQLAEQNLHGMTSGLLLSLPVLTMAVTAVVTGRYLQRFGLVRLITAGLVLISAAAAAALILPPWFLLYALAALTGIGMGMIMPALNSLIVGAADIKKRGVVSAFYGSIRSLGSALAPVGFGLILNYGINPTLTAAAVLALMGVGITLLINETELMESGSN